MDKKKNTGDRIREFDRKLLIWQVLCAVFCFVLIVYLFLIQIVDVKKYRIQAKRQRSAKSFILRGDIVDRNGIKLAADKVTFTVWAHPQYYDYSPEVLADKLADILKMPRYTLAKLLAQDNKIILLKKDIDRKTAQAIQLLGLREISLDKKTERVYPQGAMAAHVLGYYNPDADMASGVEFSEKTQLEKVENNVAFEKTPDGDVIYSVLTDPEKTTTPLKGKTVKLTIDSAIQHVCETELDKAINARHALRGAVIVMNPKNGEILGYAVSPSYDPNEYKKATQQQIKNWTLTDVYPPGSTFKVLTIASALETGRITPKTRVEDTGKMKIGWWEIKNYDYSANPYPGRISLEYLFTHSSNVGTIKIAQMMDAAEFHAMLKKFGLGEKTGINLSAESRGILPPIKAWDVATHASMGYGYASSTTFLQMASAVAAIANDGVRITPHVVKYTEDEAANNVKYTQVMSAQNARALTKILVDSVEDSKSVIKSDLYTIASKTGTSQKPKENSVGYTNKLYASIIGYFPASNPQILIYIVIDSPDGYEVWGSTVAAPVFKEVSTQVARILNIEPDKKSAKKLP